MSTPRDPYQVLGLSPSATAEDVKQAYRRLAKQYHPDLNPGKPEIERRFKEITAAYDLLSDSTRRARFDRGEIDANGNERGGGGFHRSYSGGWTGFGSAFDDSDIFSDIFQTHRPGSGARARGSDIACSVTVPFAEAALGTRRRLNLSTGKNLDVVIPPGTEDQQKLRLKGQGMPGTGGAGPGDAIVEVQVEPHPFFTRRNLDIHLDLPVSLPEAVLGATVRVPTLDGHVALKIPKGSNTDTVLRLRGKGIPDPKGGRPGDQYTRLKVMLPTAADADLVQLLETWSAGRSYDVRRNLSD